MVNLPLVPLGFGIRYESLAQSLNGSSPALSAKMTVKRLAAVVSYHFIDTLAYLGPIATYGISNSAEMTWNCPSCSGSVTSFDVNSSSMSTYSLGMEAGAKLAMLLVGGEVGYSSMNVSTFTQNGKTLQDSSNNNVGMPFSGVYFKAVLGFSF
jgi:hypothetical protein